MSRRSTPVHGGRARRVLVGGLVPFATVIVGICTTCTPTTAGATTSPAALYAYPEGGSVTPSTCPLSSTPTNECSLTDALELVAPGDTIYLSSPTSSAPVFVGNYTINTPGGSFTIKPRVPATSAARRNEGAYLDGNFGSEDGCTTEVECDGPILTVDAGSYAEVSGVTFENATAQNGGAILNSGRVQCQCDFAFNVAFENGGAVDNAGYFLDIGTFTDNRAVANGGAIYSTGSLVTEFSTFDDNSATDSGGAIDAPSSSDGELSLSSSTFVGNVAGDMGGAINLGDGDDNQPVVADDSFENNTASAGGGAVQVGPDGTSEVTLAHSTFARNATLGDTAGGAVLDNSTAEMTIENSTFYANVGMLAGAIANNASGYMLVYSSTLSSNASASQLGGTIVGRDPDDTVISANILASARGGGECEGNVDDGGYNVSDDDSCHFVGEHSDNNATAIDDDLGPLGTYPYALAGAAPSPTPSIPLTATSTASDPAFENILSTARLPGTTVPICALDNDDQRYASRRAPCDAGAFSLFGTTTSLRVSPWHLTSHTGLVTFTVTMWSQDQPAGDIPVVTGSVDIRTGSHVWCHIANVLKHPECTVPSRLIPSGTHPVTAYFLGSTNYAASTSSPRNVVSS